MKTKNIFQNKIKLVLISFAFLCLSGSVISCNDFLDKEGNTSLDEKLVFSDISGANSALNGAYTTLRSEYYYGALQTVLPEISTDNFIKPRWAMAQYDDVSYWRVQSGTYEVVNLWTTLYQGLYYVNTFLKNISNVAPTANEDPATVEAAKKAYTAEAHTLRALYMFDLLRWYCKYDLNNTLGLPYVLEPTVSSTHERKTVQATYDQILDDLRIAEELIGTRNESSISRMNIYVVYALRTRLYLYFNQNSAAYTEALKILNNTARFGYETSANFTKNVWVNENSTKEIILQVGLGPTAGAIGGLGLNSFFINASATTKPNTYYIPSASLKAIYEDPTDVRQSAYFKDTTVNTTTWGTKFKIVTKYPGNPAYAAIAGANGVNAPKIFRYAEVALNAMEAAYYSQPKTVAKGLLKDMRAARISGYDITIVDGYDDATLLAEIKKERNRELVAEGHRMFDLKRWGMGFTRPLEGNYMIEQSAIGPIAADDYHWIWPIPQAERKANPACKPNPGYEL